jgi:hypothetical protein
MSIEVVTLTAESFTAVERTIAEVNVILTGLTRTSTSHQLPRIMASFAQNTEKITSRGTFIDENLSDMQNSMSEVREQGAENDDDPAVQIINAALDKARLDEFSDPLLKTPATPATRMQENKKHESNEYPLVLQDSFSNKKKKKKPTPTKENKPPTQDSKRQHPPSSPDV